MSASSKKKLRKEQNAAQLTEKQRTEQKESKKLKTYTITFTVVIVLVLALGLGLFAANAVRSSGIIERSTDALTVGEHKLNSSELNYFFIDTLNQAYNEWYQYYGDYTATYVQMLYGLDLTQPLSAQTYSETQNYDDYFAEQAVSAAVSTYTMYDLAMAAGHTVTETEQQTIDNTVATMELYAGINGFTSLKDYLKAYYGNGATEASYREYVEVSVVAANYQQEVYDGLTYEAADLDAYNTEHFDEFSSFSYSTFTLDPDDFLVCTAAEDDKDHEHTDEENAAALQAASDAAQTLLNSGAADATLLNKAISSLDAYAEDDTAKCTEAEDTMYTNITNEDIAQWLADDTRKPGDMTVINNESTSTDDDGNETTTVTGYTVVLFLERNDNDMKLVNVRHILSSFEGGTTDELGIVTYSDTEKAAALEAVTVLRDSWVAGGGSEEDFATLATSNTDDTASASVGGLYEDVYPGQMVSAFNDWCFDESRQAGDYEIVETEYGYHLIYFVSQDEVTYRNYMIENTLRNTDYEAWYNETIEAAAHTVSDTSKLSRDIALLG